MCDSFSIPALYIFSAGIALRSSDFFFFFFTMLHLQISCAKGTILKIKENYLQAQIDQ